jgi:hypothetical protein
LGLVADFSQGDEGCRGQECFHGIWRGPPLLGFRCCRTCWGRRIFDNRRRGRGRAP